MNFWMSMNNRADGLGNQLEKPLTHTELVRATAKQTDLAINVVNDAINGAMVVIAEELRTVGEVNLKGIGKLTKVARPARPGRNPRTGEVVFIAASYGVKFKRSKMLVL